MIVAGTLLSVATVFSQQNVVPKGALDGAIHRALSSGTPRFYPLPMKSGQNPSWFLTGPNVCAIPLIEAPIKPTHDRISRLRVGPQIDPKMVLPPPVPACPKR
jgi:hypothetical protein